MNFDQSDSKGSQTIEALVPMVDLFAVLAIVFMIYASEEIFTTKVENASKIQEVVATMQRASEKRIHEILEEANNNRGTVLVKKADESLAEIKQKRAEKAQELVVAFTAMLAAQQDQAAVDYEKLVTNIESEHEQALAKELISLDEQKQQELARAEEEFAQELALVEATAEQAREKELAEQQSSFQQQSRVESAKAKQALAQAEVTSQKRLELAERTVAAEKRRAARRSAEVTDREVTELAATLKQRKEDELARAEKLFAQDLAFAQSNLEAKNRQELRNAARDREAALADQKSALEAQREEELRRAETTHAERLALKESELDADKRQALAESAQALADALADQKSTLDSEKEKVLQDTKAAFAKTIDEQAEIAAAAKQQLAPYVEAAEAKRKIVERLNENFKEFDTAAVEIDEKTGKVKLNFQESYFVRGSHQLSDDMKEFLRIMIPKYARSIYENEEAAKHVQSLKISGLTSPIYNGKYVDINDNTGRTERARRYNMTLSNKRALAMYNFIFDEDEMTDYRYRNRLKKDMGISALGFQNAKPVQPELVGKVADCLEYDCMKEQATILQFRLFSEE